MSSLTPKPKVLAAQLFSLMLVGLLTFSPVAAQEHMANFGTNNFELSMEMIPTTDGNYVTVSPIMNFNVTNAGLGIKIYLSKVDEGSNVIWSRKSVSFIHQSVSDFCYRGRDDPEARSAMPSQESIFRQPLLIPFL